MSDIEFYKKKAAEMLDALDRGDYAAYEANMSDDFEAHYIGSTLYSGTFTKEEVRDQVGPGVAQLVDCKLPMIVHNVIAEGKTVVMQTEGRATTVTGKPYHNEYCLVWTFNDEGKLCKAVEYLDTELITATFDPSSQATIETAQ